MSLLGIKKEYLPYILPFVFCVLFIYWMKPAPKGETEPVYLEMILVTSNVICKGYMLPVNREYLYIAGSHGGYRLSYAAPELFHGLVLGETIIKEGVIDFNVVSRC